MKTILLNAYSKALFSLACVFIWQNVIGQRDFSIKGRVQGLKDGTRIFLTHYNLDGVRLDTISISEVKQGTFYFNGYGFIGPEIHFVSIENIANSLTILLEKSNYSITGNLKNWPIVSITGAKSQRAVDIYNRKMVEVWNEWDSIKVKYLFFQAKGDTSSREVYANKFKENNEKANKIKKVFIEKHPNSYFTPYVILNMKVAMNEKKGYYINLSEEVKLSLYGKKLMDLIYLTEKREAIKIGGFIPNFTSFSPNSNEISLNEIISLNKLTLIDFWASWCKPCRLEIPNLKKVYEAFKDYGFSILSVSFDFSEGDWKRAIKDEKMIWHQVSQLKGWKEDAAILFGINGIPAAILVDSTGKIIAIDAPGASISSGGGSLRGEELFKLVGNELIKNGVEIN